LIKSIAFSALASINHGHWELLEIGRLLTVRHFAEHATYFQVLTSLSFHRLADGEPIALFSLLVVKESGPQ